MTKFDSGCRTYVYTYIYITNIYIVTDVNVEWQKPTTLESFAQDLREGLEADSHEKWHTIQLF